MVHKTFHKVQGNPRYQLGYGGILLLYLLRGIIVWLLAYE